MMVSMIVWVVCQQGRVQPHVAKHLHVVISQFGAQCCCCTRVATRVTLLRPMSIGARIENFFKVQRTALFAMELKESPEFLKRWQWVHPCTAHVLSISSKVEHVQQIVAEIQEGG